MKHTYLFLVFALLCVACGDEDPIRSSNSSEEPLVSHLLPQGNHPYDATIQKIYEETGTLVLYKYEQAEFDWGVTRNYLWSEERMADEGYLYQLPDEKYVGEQVDFLQSLFPNNFLKKHLPLRILLCGELYYLVGGYTEMPTESDYTPVNAFEGYEYFAVSHGNGDIATMSQDDIDQLRVELCKLLLRRVYPEVNKGDLREPIPEEFATVSTYGTDVDGSLDEGFLDDVHKSSVREDWYDYLQTIVSTPFSKLNESDGLLSHDKVKRKYNIVTDYFKKQFQIDLQHIGDMLEHQ